MNRTYIGATLIALLVGSAAHAADAQPRQVVDGTEFFTNGMGAPLTPAEMADWRGYGLGAWNEKEYRLVQERLVQQQLAQASDASKWARPNVGFAKPPSSHADTAGEAAAVPATGIQGAIDGGQITGTVPQAANALNAQQAQTAAAAQALDPNATIDPSKLNLAPCTGGKVLTVKAGTGLECVLAGSGAVGFANKVYVTAHNQTWTVPDEVFQVRLTAAAGNTVQWRQNYGQTGTSITYPTQSASWWCDNAGGTGCWFVCPTGWTVSGQYAGAICTSNTAQSVPTYGCLAPSQSSIPGQSGSRTFTVAPGDQFRATLTSTNVPVSVPAPHNQCPSNYNVVHSVMADVPDGMDVEDIWHDRRNGEAAGEQSVGSAMIVEW